jgi:biotin carboxyl carrier protein
MNNNNKSNTKLIALSNQNVEYAFMVRNNYEYSYKNKKIKVELIEEPDGFTILSANGLRYPVEILSRKQNAFEVLVNGVSYTFSIETPFSLKRNKILAASQPATNTVTIKAPMPGKIIDVLVSEGQFLNQGEPLFILEAMKMQNTIIAPIKCMIGKVKIRSGDSVAKDDWLLELNNC